MLRQPRERRTRRLMAAFRVAGDEISCEITATCSDLFE